MSSQGILSILITKPIPVKGDLFIRIGALFQYVNLAPTDASLYWLFEQLDYQQTHIDQYHY
jgi:hypothetical protein